jgi:hypothetical protein
MNPTVDAAAQLFAEEVARARAMPGADKLLEGARLFDRTCRILADGIRHRHPELDADGIRARLLAQLDLARRLENQR